MAAPSFVVVVGMESPDAQGPHQRAADRLDCGDPLTLPCQADAWPPSNPGSDWSRDFNRVRHPRTTDHELRAGTAAALSVVVRRHRADGLRDASRSGVLDGRRWPLQHAERLPAVPSHAAEARDSTVPLDSLSIVDSSV